jgi:N-acetylglucosamine-6-phosphate deacetylase
LLRLPPNEFEEEVNNKARSLLLHNARIVLPDRIAEADSLLIESDRIANVFDTTQTLPMAESVIDLKGCTLYPGFIDAHIHGAAGVDTLAASVDDLRRAGEFAATRGVTAWLPTLVPAREEDYAQAVNAISQILDSQESQFAPAALSADGTSALPARVLGVHYEGPFVNSEQCGALHRKHFRTFTSVSDLESLPTIKHDQAVHMMTLAPEVEGGVELIKELRRRGWVVSIGHTRAKVEVLDQAFQAGARHMTHFMNAMTPLHHRTLGVVGWGLTHDDVTCDLIADGVHIDPAILKVILRCKTAARVALISDAIAATGLGDGDYEIWGEKIAVQNGRTQNARGSIAGSVITMLDAVCMMLSLGASEGEVARMASLNPARTLGIDGDCGSIEEGKRADLVALDREGNVRLTLVAGCVAYRVD